MTVPKHLRVSSTSTTQNRPWCFQYSMVGFCALLMSYAGFNEPSILAASLVSRLGMGYLSDKTDSWFLAFASMFSSCIIVFVLWGVAATSLSGLIAFGLIFGVFGCGWTCLWTGLMKDIASMCLTLPIPLLNLFSLTLVCRG